MDGIIIVNKPAGFTSQDVVAKLRGIYAMKRIGHTGTLDPDATGVLPVCLGKACRLCDMLTDRDKEYIAELLLGVSTVTQDISGQVLIKNANAAADIKEAKAIETVMSFVGEYDQIPPMYSAIKINGKKLYELARAGIEVERKPRRVEIKEIEILKTKLPVIRFRVVCSKGTYIRTLCNDIGERLGCGGTLQSLIRSRSGEFKLEESHTLEEIQRLKNDGMAESIIIPTDSVFKYLPEIHIQKGSQRLVDNGNPFVDSDVTEYVTDRDKAFRVYSEDGRFIGIYEYSYEKNKYMPKRMFV